MNLLEIRSASWQLALLANAYMTGHVFNSRRTTLKSSSVNDILCFNSAFKAKNEAYKVDQNVSYFALVLFESF